MCTIKIGDLKYLDIHNNILMNLDNNEIVTEPMVPKSRSIYSLYNFDVDTDDTEVESVILKIVYHCVAENYRCVHPLDIDKEVFGYSSCTLRDIVFFNADINEERYTLIKYNDTETGLYTRHFIEHSQKNEIHKKVKGIYEYLYNSNIYFSEHGEKDFLNYGRVQDLIYDYTETKV